MGYEEDELDCLDHLFSEDIEPHELPAVIDPYELLKPDKVAIALEDENGDGTDEPPWLILPELFEGEDIGPDAEEAEARAEYIDSLPDDSDRPVADLEDVCVHLVQYLIGHPTSLVTKRRKGTGKGKQKNRYFGEERSTDVMADKVVTGCWVCGKLTHESHECEFKRCFNCSQVGHEYGECPLKKIKCKRCHAPGHEEEDCHMPEYEAGIIVKDSDSAAKTVVDEIEYTDVSFCRCVRCGEDEHLNCAPIPEAKIDEPAGYHAANSGSVDPWSAPPPKPGQMLRPRAAASWQPNGGGAMMALGGPRPPSLPPPGMIGKGGAKSSVMPTSTLPPRPSAAPKWQSNGNGWRAPGVIAPLKRPRPADDGGEWGSLWDDVPEEPEEHSWNGNADSQGGQNHHSSGRLTPQNRQQAPKWGGKGGGKNQGGNALGGGGGWNGNGGGGRNGGGGGQWGGSGRQGGWQKSSW